MNHLIILGSVWPEPNSSAAGGRMLQLIEQFQRERWRVTFASAAALSEHRANLIALGVDEVSVVLNCSSFDRWLAEQRPTAVLFDRFMTEEQFGWRVAQTCPEALRLLDTEDLHSLRAARAQLLKQRQSALGGNERERQAVGPVLDGTDALYQVMAESDIAQRELASIYRSDLSLMISEFEMTLLQEQFGVPESLLHYQPLWGHPHSEVSAHFEQRAHFVSIGNFRHGPNWDAVLWLKHRLWPALRERLPGAELHLYGAYPPPKATALHNPAQGFLVKGWARDARAVMASARVCLAPLRFGAGIKGKLLDALACQTPSVTTPIGAEGMAGNRPWPGAVADTEAALVDAAEQLYRDRATWQQAQAECLALLGERFAPLNGAAADTPNRNLAARVRLLSTGLKQHRRNNFIGALLQHHQHRSTQYMSQWIEAKTRGA